MLLLEYILKGIFLVVGISIVFFLFVVLLPYLLMPVIGTVGVVAVFTVLIGGVTGAAMYYIDN